MTTETTALSSAQTTKPLASDRIVTAARTTLFDIGGADTCGATNQGDSKNRILLGLTGLANQILSTSQRQMLEALTDAYALGCFE